MDQRIDIGYQVQLEGKTLEELFDEKVNVERESTLTTRHLPNGTSASVNGSYTYLLNDEIRPGYVLSKVRIFNDLNLNATSYVSLFVREGSEYKCIQSKAIIEYRTNDYTDVVIPDWHVPEGAVVGVTFGSSVSQFKASAVGSTTVLDASAPAVGAVYEVKPSIALELAVYITIKGVMDSQTSTAITMSDVDSTTIADRIAEDRVADDKAFAQVNVSIESLEERTQKLVSDVDDAVVHMTGAESISGEKHFTNSIVVENVYTDSTGDGDRTSIISSSSSTLNVGSASLPLVLRTTDGISALRGDVVDAVAFASDINALRAADIETEDDGHTLAEAVVTYGDQSISGTKTFDTGVKLDSMTDRAGNSVVAAASDALSLGSEETQLSLRSIERPTVVTTGSLTEGVNDQIVTSGDFWELKRHVTSLSDYYWTFDTYDDLLDPSNSDLPDGKSLDINDFARVRADATHPREDGTPQHTSYIYTQDDPDSAPYWKFDSIVDTADRNFVADKLTTSEASSDFIRAHTVSTVEGKPAPDTSIFGDDLAIGKDATSVANSVALGKGSHADEAGVVAVGNRRIVSVADPSGLAVSEAETAKHTYATYVTQMTDKGNASVSSTWGRTPTGSVGGADTYYNSNDKLPAKTRVKQVAVFIDSDSKASMDDNLVVLSVGSFSVQFESTGRGWYVFSANNTELNSEAEVRATTSAAVRLGTIPAVDNVLKRLSGEDVPNTRVLIAYSYENAVESSQTGSVILSSRDSGEQLSRALSRLEENKIERFSYVSKSFSVEGSKSSEASATHDVQFLIVSDEPLPKNACRVTRVRLPNVDGVEHTETVTFCLFRLFTQGGKTKAAIVTQQTASAPQGGDYEANVDWTFSPDVTMYVGVIVREGLKVALASSSTPYKYAKQKLFVQGLRGNFTLSSAASTGTLIIDYDYELLQDGLSGDTVSAYQSSFMSIRQYIDDGVKPSRTGYKPQATINAEFADVTIDAAKYDVQLIEVVGVGASSTVRIGSSNISETREIELFIEVPKGQSIRLIDIRTPGDEPVSFSSSIADLAVFMRVLIRKGEAYLTHAQVF
jgi:hypothetical protein